MMIGISPPQGRLLLLNIPRRKEMTGDYSVSVARGGCHWPRDGANLTAAGAWNLFFRLGFAPCFVDEGMLPETSGDDIVFVACHDDLPDWARGWLGKVRAWGAAVVWSGLAQPYADLAEVRVLNEVVGHPLHGLAWLPGGEGSPSLMAPPGWRVAEFEGGDASVACAAVGGERQTPSRATLQRLDVPMALCRERMIYLSGDPCGAFQGWLQGHYDLNPWLAWRHRLYWLDEQAAAILDLLRALGVDMDRLSRPGIPSLGETTVVLRHDLDSSRDTTYLDSEVAAEIPGVHAVLLDRNALFWIGTASRAAGHEIAFHYNTIHQPLRQRVATRLGVAEPAYRPALGEIVGDALLKQVWRARRRGIVPETLHRHGPFILYPESILALDEVFRRDEQVVGSSSWFRGAVLRWGVDRVDGIRGSQCDAPDIQFPLAFPFRLCDASDGGRLLDGWESTCLMEPEPDLVARLLDYRPREIRQRVLVLNYHPAHAQRSTFVRGGSLPWFRDILALLRERGVAVLTMAGVFRAAGKAVAESETPSR